MIFDCDQDEFGSMGFTALEALEEHLESGRPLSEGDAERLIQEGLAVKKDFKSVGGGFRYVGTRWTV